MSSGIPVHYLPVDHQGNRASLNIRDSLSILGRTEVAVGGTVESSAGLQSDRQRNVDHHQLVVPTLKDVLVGRGKPFQGTRIV